MDDEQFMREALALAKKGVGLTAPNPSVGAVLVREGEIIGRGFHQGAGLPHAEIEALQDARRNGKEVKGAAIYVTLEPCSTKGRTGACTQALIKAGVQRVLWAIDDPNPVHAGQAHEILRNEGLQTESGLCETEAGHLIRAFTKVQQKGRPWVIVKTALSLDGRITRRPEEGQWLTSPEMRETVQDLRLEADAILTSGQTARIDNPRLNYRGSKVEKKQPLRLVVTSQPHAGLSPEAHLLSDGQATRFLSGELVLRFQELAAEGIQTILVEAGGHLVGSLLDQGLVDEWVSDFAPFVAGGPNLAVAGEGAFSLEKRPRLKDISSQQMGSEIRVRGLIIQ